MSDFILSAIELVGVVVASALIWWVINELAAQEIKELFKEKEEKEGQA